MRTAGEIREHFLDTLNNALPRLGMFGGEIVARYFLSHLAFVDDRDAELKMHLDALKERGVLRP